MQGLEYPIKIRVENEVVIIKDGTGNGLNERLKSGEELTIENSLIGKLFVSNELIPEAFYWSRTTQIHLTQVLKLNFRFLNYLT